MAKPVADELPTQARPGRTVAAIRGAVVTFGETTVLHGVDLELKAGHVHAVVGQNGAGKSTLVKALMGVNRLAAGHVEIDGAPVKLAGPSDARQFGLEIVYQDQPLASHLTVAENMFLGREPVVLGAVLDRASMHNTAAEVLARVGANVSPTDIVGDLTPTQRVQISIAAALAAKPRVLVLDEPTAALGSAEAGPVFDLVRTATSEGVAVLYISHRLGEITSLAHDITVLRDGRRVHSSPATELSTDEMISAMVGRDLETLYPTIEHTPGEVLLTTQDLRSGELVTGMNLEIRSGEIVGLAGLVGSGASETLLALFGATKAEGDVRITGSNARAHSPRSAIAQGMALIPEERRTEAIFPGLSLSNNVTASSLAKHSRLSILSRNSEKRTTQDLVARLNIIAASTEQDIATLSGGNQQKAIVGRWLARGGQVYLVDEPTAGVDVGAKIEIYRQLGELAAAGAAVLVVSSDFEELIGICDRLLVVRDGKVTGQHLRGEIDVEKLTSEAAAVGATAEDVQKVISHANPETPKSHSHGAKPRAIRSKRPWARQIGLPAAMVLIVIILAIGSPAFAAPLSLIDIVRQASTPALLAGALAIALGAGAFDLSVGAVALLTSTVSAALTVAGAPLPIAVVAGIVIGAVIGLINGSITVLFRVPSFVATLGMLFLLAGATLQINGGAPIGVDQTNIFLMLGQGYVGFLPVVALVAVAVIAIATFVWRRTAAGLRLRAVGDDAKTADLRGVNAGRNRMVALVISASMSGLAGVLLASYGSGSTARDASLDLLTTALAAAFLGSAMTRSFLFDPATAAIGALFVTAVGAGLISNGLSDQWLPGVQGLVLLLAVLLAVVRRRSLGQVAIF
jgi:ABC-type sugar transport system ATPase subunit/ribose/xylose/arabinose/galactoside ABC-type transport system permease subunit